MIFERTTSANLTTGKFSPILYSIWNVKRSIKSPIFTQKLRGKNEPNDLFGIFFSISGHGSFVTKTNSFILQDNELIVCKISDIVTYNGINTEPWEYYCINYLSNTPMPYFEEQKVYNIHFSTNILTLLDNLFNTSITDTCIRENYVLSNFTFLISSLVKDHIERQQSINPYYNEIQQCIDYIKSNIKNNITVQDLLNKYKISNSTLYRSFVNITGLSPKKYISQEKYNYAKILLKSTNQTIESIALQLNFYSAFQFSRDFKKQFGMTPSKYRNNGSVNE